MYLYWNSLCYKCEAPLDPVIKTRGDDNKKFVRNYRKIRPIYLDNNSSMYSFVGLELKKVCYSCFLHKVKIQPKLLRHREYGHIKNIAPRSLSKTSDEILFWFSGLKRSHTKTT